VKKILAAVALGVLGSTGAFAQTAYYQGRALNMSGSDRPFYVGNTMMVPVRRAMDLVGGTLDRNTRGNDVVLRWQNRRINYVKGESTFSMNGARYKLGGSSRDRNGVLFVPSELISALTNGDFYVEGDNGWGNGPVAKRYPTDRDRWSGRWDTQGNNPRWDGGRWNQGGNWNGGRTNQGSDYGRGVYWDNRLLSFNRNEEPYEKGGTLMVPFRALADKLGMRTDRTADGRRVWIYYQSDRVEYDQGRTWYRLNQDQRDLKTNSEDRGGILFVPMELFTSISGNRLRMSGY
jgi:hypothetical protein